MMDDSAEAPHIITPPHKRPSHTAHTHILLINIDIYKNRFRSWMGGARPAKNYQYRARLRRTKDRHLRMSEKMGSRKLIAAAYRADHETTVRRTLVIDMPISPE